MSEATEPQAPPKTTVGVSIDGKHFEANPGELLIAAAERAGTYIPRFCWHPRMREVGMCRMCLVDVDGPRGPSLQPACMLPVTEGMKVDTQSATVKKAQDGVLEFLLINHPIDCPVCDKGGECPLQDQTMTFGPGETRFVEEKRHYEKPIAISDLVNLDRERCILCDRCTRFSKEVAGDPLIHFISRGNATEVNTFPDDPFASYFSGNVVQICPVGALTAQPYRFVARPWDIDQVESTCTSCSVGCRVVLQSSGDRITRVQGVDADPVNWGWLCDKGRFDVDSVGSEARLSHPMVRKGAGTEPVEVPWYEALETAASVLRNLAPDQIGVIGGARLSNEDQYAWAKLLKGGLGIDNVDAQLGDGLNPQTWLGLPQATIDEACSADLVILLSPDVKEELPVLFLRLRDAAANRRVPFIEITPKGTGMSRYVRHSLQHRPGEAPALVSALMAAISGPAVDRQVAGVEADAVTAAARTIAAALQAGTGKGPGAGKVVIVAGRTSLSESVASIEEALAGLLRGVDGRGAVLGAPRRSNVRGALDMGLSPGLLPGRVSRSAGSAWFASHWGRVPEADGLDTIGMLKAAAEGRVKALVLLGADPLTDVPDRALVDAAFAKVEHIVAIDTFANASVARAAVILPAAGYAEKSGTTTNLEGRVTRLSAKVSAPGVARPDWMIAVELAARLGIDLGVESVDDLTEEIARVAPSHLGLGLAALTARGAANGVIVPLPVAPTDSVADPVADVTSEAPTEGAQGAEEPTSEAEAPAPTVPALLGAPVAAASIAPQPDSYSLRLVSSHLLYDDGTIVGHSAALAKLAPGVSLHLHPGEIERHGLRAGDSVRVRSQRTAVVLTVVDDPLVPRGSAFVPFGQAGTEASELIDLDELSASGVVKVRLETVGED